MARLDVPEARKNMLNTLNRLRAAGSDLKAMPPPAIDGRHFQGARARASKVHARTLPRCTRHVGNLRRAECSCTLKPQP